MGVVRILTINTECLSPRTHGQDSHGLGGFTGPHLLHHSTDALFCFLALKETDHTQMVGGFFENRRTEFEQT